MTVYADELTPGLSESMSRTVSEQDVQLFGEATGDMNPVHFDEAFARKTVFRGRVAHGALTIGFVSALLGTRLPGAGSIFLGATLDFKAPVRIGDTVVTTCTMRSIEGREALFDCVCAVGDRVVMEAQARVLAPKRPAAKAGA